MPDGEVSLRNITFVFAVLARGTVGPVVGRGSAVGEAAVGAGEITVAIGGGLVAGFGDGCGAGEGREGGGGDVCEAGRTPGNDRPGMLAGRGG